MIGHRLACAFAAAVALMVGIHCGPAVALATPIGDAYTLTGGNFPTNFLASGPLTFNALGDTTAEAVPGAGLTVVEGFGAGLGPHGGDLLGFQFTLTSPPADGSAPFGFLIGDIDFSNNAALTVLGAALGISFGVSSLPLTDVSSLISSVFAGGLDVTFISPVSWADIFAATSPPAGVPPTEFVVTFLVEVRQVPEPSTLLLLAFGVFGMTYGVRSKALRQGRRDPAFPLDA